MSEQRDCVCMAGPGHRLFSSQHPEPGRVRVSAEPSFKVMDRPEGQSSGEVFALPVANPGSIASIPYGPLNTTRSYS